MVSSFICVCWCQVTLSVFSMVISLRGVTLITQSIMIDWWGTTLVNASRRAVSPSCFFLFLCALCPSPFGCAVFPFVPTRLFFSPFLSVSFLLPSAFALQFRIRTRILTRR